VSCRIAKKQTYDNSCGAAGLLCVALELGVRTLPQIHGSLCTGQILEPNRGCETALYQITSGAMAAGLGPGGAGLVKAGYSLPHNVVVCARHMGLEGRVYLQRGVYSVVLELLYASCIRQCEEFGIEIVRSAPPALRPFQRELVIVGVLKVAALHYVMHRPDGTFMDPLDGRNYACFGAMNNSWLKSYSHTGISLVFEPGRNGHA